MRSMSGGTGAGTWEAPSADTPEPFAENCLSSPEALTSIALMLWTLSTYLRSRASMKV